MRTTVRLDPEVQAAAEQLRRARHIGLGEAVNELAKAGIDRTARRKPFKQQTSPVGLRIDVSNVAEVLEHLDAMDSAE